MLQVFRKGEKGFTLIELLVVIAIIGVLSTIVLVSLNTAREKARDVRRVSDMRQVALGLEMYYDSHTDTGYPGTVTGSTVNEWDTMDTALEGDGFITSVPTDPGTNTYEYWVASGNQSYVLNATLEDGDHSALDDDIDGLDVLGCNCENPEYCVKP